MIFGSVMLASRLLKESSCAPNLDGGLGGPEKNRLGPRVGCSPRTNMRETQF